MDDSGLRDDDNVERFTPPKSHRVMPRSDAARPQTMMERLAQGPLLDLALARVSAAVEVYWQAPSGDKLRALLQTMRPLGAWLTTPAKQYDDVWVLDPNAARQHQGNDKLVAPMGAGFAKRRRIREATYRTLKGKRVLGLVAGGIGDLILFSQVARKLRECDGCTIDVATYGGRGDEESNIPPALLRQLYAPGEVHLLPMKESLFASYDYVQPLGLFQVLTGETLSSYIFRTLGVRLHGLGFDLDEEAVERVSFRLQHRHGLDLRSGGLVFVQATCRPDKRYPHTDEVVSRLLQAGKQVVLIGALADSTRLDEPGKLANLCGVDVWDSIQAMRYAGCVLTPDSAFLHAAGALYRPTVALFGPSPVLWSEPYPSVTALCLPNACRFLPCWVHQGDMPPCGVYADRPCLSEIPAEVVVKHVLAKLAGKEDRRMIELPILPRVQIVVRRG